LPGSSLVTLRIWRERTEGRNHAPNVPDHQPAGGRARRDPKVIERRIGELLTPAIEIINEALDPYDPIPLGLEKDEFVTFAMSQFQARVQRVEKAREQSLEEIHRLGQV
jgi:hypothetical protein